MPSIRAFSEILRDTDGITREEQNRYASIIHDEAIRLTRLLDDLLDLSVLENGQVSLNIGQGVLSDVLDRAVAAALAHGDEQVLMIHRHRSREEVILNTDTERLSQVFINLIANARKYCDAGRPELSIHVEQIAGSVNVDFVDNGSGVAPEAQDVIFEKFARVSDQKAGGAGLGLAICRQIVSRLGGEISYLPGRGGAAFRVSLPLNQALAAQ
jgi:signal transduction histidine kinase